MELAGRRVTVMGLGHFGGGVAVTRWLASKGAEVTVTDLADSQTLSSSLGQLAGVPVAKYALGGHREADFRNIDLLVVNPAVKPGNRFVQVARGAGARVATEMELFLEHCPAAVVGVTGSNGKSTTAAMIDAILRANGRTSWLGGNLGGSLLDHAAAIQPGDCAVLEMSSFQLWHFGPLARMPHVAVVTSFSPNHLDWHGVLDDYKAAKQRLLLEQAPDGFAVLNTHDTTVASWAPAVRGRLAALPALGDLPELRVPGYHNRINAACAAAAAAALGCSRENIRLALEQFRGLPERRELIATVGGVELYDDSAATTPESTVAAIRSSRRPIWLLAGGYDKGLDYAELTAAIAEGCRGAAFFGAVRAQLRQWTNDRNPELPSMATERMHEALDWCWRHASRGDAIVLSPACSSHDQFLNFRHRGEVFRGLVESLVKRYNQ
ncbi:MAG: UDP-N-acetylmuramoyl-L-alanine--D-glutamate ligase [Thermoguttaceae bacterium]|jgi:UDP-N-acetylmuramoylalanine--D-glutamate ligase|nr:UDP-N-acetylmuramoyl-L-alanine--D-glutamate ligase [Thermoguttaceae bacterium]